MTPAQDVAAQVIGLLREIGDMVADSRRYLQRLCEYEEERRVEERRLAAMAESIWPAKREAALDPGVPLSEWDTIPWGEPQVEGQSQESQSERSEDWWYRDTRLVYRERGSHRKLTQDEIDLIHNPPGRDRPRQRTA